MKARKAIFVAAVCAVCLTACHRKTFDERMTEEVEAYQREHLPRQADERTIETARTYRPQGRALIQEFDVVPQGDDIDALFTPQVKAQVRDELLKSLTYDIQAKTMKDSSVTFVYRYRNQETRRVLMDIRLTPKDYK